MALFNNFCYNNFSVLEAYLSWAWPLRLFGAQDIDDCQKFVFCYRFKQSVVTEVLEQRRAARSNNPVNVWKGSFRDEAPIDHDHKAWKPNGTANLCRI